MVGRLTWTCAIAADLLQANDAAVLDDDVDWSDRRGAGAVDHSCAAQRKPPEGTDSAVAGGRLGDDRDLALVTNSRKLIAGGNLCVCLIDHGAFPLLSSVFRVRFCAPSLSQAIAPRKSHAAKNCKTHRHREQYEGKRCPHRPV